MHKDISEVIQDQQNTKWDFSVPKNSQYQNEYKLNKQVKYGRTIYIPYNRVIVISGSESNKPVRDVFQFHLLTN